MCRNEKNLGARLASAAVAMTLGNGALHATTLDVPAGYATIQDAIDAAADGDEVVIANGTYGGDLEIFDKAITLTSASEDPALCIIDGGFTGVLLWGADTFTTVRGLTIRNASRGVEVNSDASGRFENCIIEDCGGAGGMFMNGELLRIIDCTIRNNSTTNAGGGLIISSGEARITGTLFRNNAVTGFNALGGGIHAGGEALVIADCTFRENTAIGTNSGLGGGLYVFGATDTPVVVVNTRFYENESNTEGGGMYLGYRDAELGNVQFVDNTSLAGGGMFIENVGGAANRVTIANAVFAGNEATNGRGGGLRQNQDSWMSVTNATIFGNTSTQGGGGVDNGSNSTAAFANCIVGSNTANDFAGVGVTTVTYSNVGSGFAGTGNISAGPDFVDAAGGDFRLTASSPCIDAGNTVAYNGPPTDPDGNVRALDDPEVDNTGFALSTGAIDMGAYEQQPVDSCPADIDDNGLIDVSDLLDVLNGWGMCP